MKNLGSILMILIGVISCTALMAQTDIRTKFQSKLDSIITPYEKSTGADFGPGLSFSFKEPYVGIMRSEGSMYTGQLNSIAYKEGDKVSLGRVGILGSKFAYAQFESHEEPAMLGAKEINKLVELQDSAAFWNQFEKIKQVKTNEFAQYWMVLDCDPKDDATEYEEKELVWMNFGTTSLTAYLRKQEEKYLLEFDFSRSVGKDLMGLGCAESEDAFVEFKFDDGTVLKKNNSDLEYCQILVLDISNDLSTFEKAIVEMKFSMSKKERSLKIDHEIPQNQINLKLDCLIK